LGTGYAVSSDVAGAFTNPELEIVNYYDNYDFIGRNLTGTMPTVTVNDSQKQYACGFQTGQVVYATNGEALGSVNVYDQKGQMVRTVRKGLKGYLEDVSTDYTFTGDVENTVADVDVKYGSHFTAETAYSYEYGKKTNMVLSVSHGQSARPYETEYTYDALGRLSGKERAMTGTGKSLCSYTYNVHDWLTDINSGSFHEQLFYTDGLDGGCYNGNISTVKWKRGDYGPYQGYNLKYDGSNRLTSAVFGEGDNLTSYKNYYDEYAEYDCNGNITRMNRRGLVDNMHGGFGFVDNLRMTYEGNMLTSVRDNASRMAYAGATDFDGVSGQEYPLTYNDAGSLVSDAGRKIARIDYDLRNNPVRIQFTNGNVTKYVYSATGEKLRVIYQTAVPNITVAIGSTRELSRSEIQYTDSTDYLLGGSLTLKNGRIDKYLFDEGYCQAGENTVNVTQDYFTINYYDRDHLGNIRQVTRADRTKTGTVIQSMDYYPFGAKFCHSGTDNNVQPYRYNGKEYDRMHGLNTYDYGARQYNPITARWDRVDPLCEDYYPHSQYAYCLNNPVNVFDPDGRKPKIKNRLWGALQMIGGAAEMVGSGTSEYFSGGTASPVAIPLFMNGVDNFQAGFQQMWTGDEQETFLHKGVEAAATSLGVDKGTSMAIIVAIDLSSGNFKSPQKIESTISSANALLRSGKNFSIASKYGIGSYNSLKSKVGKGSSLQVHHLIERRFAHLFKVKEGDMLSIVLTKEEHQAFTNAWRKAIPYDNSVSDLTTSTAMRNDIINAAKRIYSKYPEILKALGL
jgi:RHS repeat-associated protein